MSFSIKDWSHSDRPREKMLNNGHSVLSDAELLAIIIGSGSTNESAVMLSQRILSSVDNNLLDLGTLSITDFTSFRGIGEAKAVSIVAALELGRRRNISTSVARDKVTSSKVVFELMWPVLGDLKHEEFWVLYMNNANVVLQKCQISKGGLTATLVDQRVLLKKAIEIGAVNIILVHNHPSGMLTPSEADKNLTKKIITASEHLDIKVLDHIIIGHQSYLSFADSALI